MAAVTSIVAAAAVGLGAASAISQRNDARRQQRRQREAARQATIEAKEAAALKAIKKDTGAKVKIGAEEGTKVADPNNKKGGVKRKSTSLGLGGLTAPSASKIGGL